MVSLGDGSLGLYRVHVAQHRLGQSFAHQPHLDNRGNVIVRDPGIPQHAQQRGRRIGLDRIERLARKLLCEETSGAFRGLRTVQNNGFVGRERANYSRCVLVNVQLKGPPIGLSARPTKGRSCLAVWKSPWGSGGPI